ncbi:Ger(x)C family spore germination protein [Paenibacillus sp. JCM 10914]|uniref:Ger(x)C family spore germination protein n=1 Tax=Paenibacillus sp. JCM 10914 TaxID=1236974 RepID=UPI0003CC2754|nr:Ger(x)C family spore germination protein [Paenibacillus sp. JCM 10914]GAE08370.1 spore germination protein [Paenibacillus sp. JCM 10914]
MNYLFLRYFRIALCIILLTHLTGCWDQIELEDRALILGIGIDEAEPDAAEKEDLSSHHAQETKALDDRMIRVTAQIAVPGRIPLGPGGNDGSSEGKNEPVWVVSVVGHTLHDALSNLQQEIADPRSLIHLRVIVVNEKIARRGLDDLNDYLRRNQEVRRSTWLLVTDNIAADLMNVAPPLERVPTLYLLAMLEKAQGMGKFPKNSLSNFWNSESKMGQNAFLPYVSIRQQDNILIGGLAYFNSSKLVGTTTPFEIGAYMAANGINPGGYSALYNVPGIGFVTIRTTARESNIEVKIQNGRPHATISINVQAELAEKYSPAREMDDQEELDLAEQEFNRVAKSVLSGLIKKTQQGKSDIFGFGEIVRAHQRQFWHEHIHKKSDWENLYSDMTYTIHMNTDIRRVGMKID